MSGPQRTVQKKKQRQFITPINKMIFFQNVFETFGRLCVYICTCTLYFVIYYNVIYCYIIYFYKYKILKKYIFFIIIFKILNVQFKNIIKIFNFNL